MPWDPLIDFIKTHFVEFLEMQFILNSDMSSLDLLPYDQAHRYKDFKWHQLDYIGGPSKDPTNGAPAIW